MKFITTQDRDGKEELFIFPRNINHDAMAEVLGYIKNQTHGNWSRVFRKPISAGFIEGGKCCGMSESLKLKARPEDTALLLAQGRISPSQPGTGEKA